MKREGYAILKIISLLMNHKRKDWVCVRAASASLTKEKSRAEMRRMYEREIVSFDGLACN